MPERYHANGRKLLLETKRMNALSTSSALTNETTNAHRERRQVGQGQQVTALVAGRAALAANITGTARKNENSAAARREQPSA